MPKRKEPGRILVRCKGAALVDIAQLTPFQGNFKTMTTDELARLKRQLIAEGITAAATVWKRGEPQKKTSKPLLYLLDGHQRHRALTELRGEGWKVPPIPASFTDCKDEAHARRIVLGLASTYGRVNGDELVSFAGLAKVPLPELDLAYSFPDLGASFKDWAAPEAKHVEFKVKPKAPVACPKCGHKFTPAKAKAS